MSEVPEERGGIILRYKHLLCCLVFLTGAPLLPAASVTVQQGGDLQAALNQAVGGDTIRLQAGATFPGNFTVSKNGTDRTITIQSSAIGQLPGSGQRVSNIQASLMPKLITSNAAPVLSIPSDANHYRFVGIEFTMQPGVYVNDLISCGEPGERQAAHVPQNIEFDRVYIHGQLPTGSKRGIALNSGKTTIWNSYFENFVSDWQDTQAICGWNGTGPFLIQNNWLQSGAEIVAFGGAVPAIQGLIPSDITIQYNDFYKPAYWWDGDPNHWGPHIRAKNHIEFKNGQRALIQYNTFTNNMVGADQNGFTILLNVRDEGGQVPWATVSDITVQHNLFRHVAGGFLIAGRDHDGGGTANNIKIQNNLMSDMGVMGGEGSGFEIVSGSDNLTIDHNTLFPKGWMIVFVGRPNRHFAFTNNIISAGMSLAGDTGGNPQAPRDAGRGQGAMSYFAPDGVFSNNVIIAANPNDFTGPSFVHNRFVDRVEAIRFTDPAEGNYSLAPNSAFRGIGASGELVRSGRGAAPAFGSEKPRVPYVLPPAPKRPALPPNAKLGAEWMIVQSKNSHLCLDVPTWSGNNMGKQPGTQLQQATCKGSPSQQFRFLPVQGGYRIVSQVSGLGLDVAGGPGAVQNGAGLLQWPYWGGTNQIFTVEDRKDGTYAIHPIHSQQCLDVVGVAVNPGALVQQWACTGGANQAWMITPVAGDMLTEKIRH